MKKYSLEKHEVAYAVRTMAASSDGDGMELWCFILSWFFLDFIIGETKSIPILLSILDIEKAQIAEILG